MAVSDTRKETPSDEVGPSVGIDLGTRQAKAGFAGEGNTAYFTTVAASVLNKAHLFGIAAVEHFLDDRLIVGRIVARMPRLEQRPVVAEDLLERFFTDWHHRPASGGLPFLKIRRKV